MRRASRLYPTLATLRFYKSPRLIIPTLVRSYTKEQSGDKNSESIQETVSNKLTDIWEKVKISTKETQEDIAENTIDAAIALFDNIAEKFNKSKQPHGPVNVSISISALKMSLSMTVQLPAVPPPKPLVAKEPSPSEEKSDEKTETEQKDEKEGKEKEEKEEPKPAKMKIAENIKI